MSATLVPNWPSVPAFEDGWLFVVPESVTMVS